MQKDMKIMNLFIFTNRVEFTGLRHNLLTDTFLSKLMIDCNGVYKTDSHFISTFLCTNRSGATLGKKGGFRN